MKTKFTVDYFIKKFEAIPEEKWGTGQIYNRNDDTYCAYGHCGVVSSGEETKEAIALTKLIVGFFGEHRRGAFYQNLSWQVTEINDSQSNQHPQPTPKQRILAALYDIKKLQEKESPDYTIKLSVSSGEIMEHLTEAKLQLS